MLTQEEHKALIRVVERIRVFENRNKRNISARFLDLPSETELADYWANVDRPRSINLVRVANVNAVVNKEREAKIYQDLIIIFRNGLSFFGRSTEAWRDSQRMEVAVDETFDLEGAKVPSLLVENLVAAPEPAVKEEDSLDLPRKRQRKSTTPHRFSPPPPPSAALPVVFGRETDSLVHQLILAYKSGAQETYIPPYPEPTAEDFEDGAAKAENLGSAIATPAEADSPEATDIEMSEPPVANIDLLQHLPVASPTAFSGATPAVIDLLDNGVSRAPSAGSENSHQGISTPGPSAPTNKEERGPDSETGWLLPARKSAQFSVYYSIFNDLKKAADVETGRVLSEILKRPPPADIYPNFLEKVTDPITFEDIETRLAGQTYKTPEEFDRDLYRIFADSKKWLHRTGEHMQVFGDVCALQRLYNSLTRSTGEDAALPAKHARVGPGSEESKQTTEDKDFLDSINYKGQVYKHGDWVHLYNFAHPEKPVVGQIWKIFKRKENGERCFNVCWFYRPEETVHPINKTFLENEVAKTLHFIDHDVEDVLERCCVMYITRYTRGRPKPPIWNPDMPTYVCENRYKDSEKSFKRIKNWATCIPDEAKAADANMQLDLFAAPVHLRKVKSPFAVEEPVAAAPVKVVEELELALDRRAHASTLSTTFVPNRHAANTVYAATGGADSTPKPISQMELAVANDSFDPIPSSVGQPFLFPQSQTLRVPAKLFRCDPSTGEMLWFSSPPVKIHHPVRPTHSAEYLRWVAQKKTGEVQTGAGTTRQVIPQKRSLVDQLADFL